MTIVTAVSSGLTKNQNPLITKGQKEVFPPMQEYTRIIIQNVGPAANAEFVCSGGPSKCISTLITKNIFYVYVLLLGRRRSKFVYICVAIILFYTHDQDSVDNLEFREFFQHIYIYF